MGERLRDERNQPHAKPVGRGHPMRQCMRELRIHAHIRVQRCYRHRSPYDQAYLRALKTSLSTAQQRRPRVK